MKKRILTLFILALTILPLISALNLDIEETKEDVAMVIGSGMPAIFDLKITNHGEADNLVFYNFFGIDTIPKETPIAKGEIKEVAVGIYPGEDLKQEGRFKFDLYIKSQSGEQMTYPLAVNIVSLGKAFTIGAEEFDPESNTVSIYIKNTVNFNFNEINSVFSSPFFKFEKNFSLPPYQKEVFEVSLNKEEFRDLMAGFYTLKAEIEAGNKKADVEGVIKFSEKNIVTSTQNEYGIIIHTKSISKVNEGNVISTASTVIKKNIISRLFTTFSPEPDIVERKGLSVYYSWEEQLDPGERIDIYVRTNWLLPLLAVFLVIMAVMLAKQLSRTNLSLKKRVSFVRAKGGEFALKVSVFVTARKFVERVNVIDRLPALVKIHERFGGEVPKKVDEKNRKIEWYFDRLQPGESRVISYIIYSKVGVLGKFALPTATAVYEKDGEVHESESNNAFFIADQIKKDVGD